MRNCKQRISSKRILLATSWLAAVLLLTACAPHGALLNSDRIAARYGSYHVQVLRQTETQRVSSLASRHDGHLITRTLAITDFAKPQAAYADVSEKIRRGASIGSSFRDAGWAVSKQTLYVDSISVTSRDVALAQMMDIALPQDLALHIYRFTVSRRQESLAFATIAELHHPDYMHTKDLQRIYGTPSALADSEIAELRSAVNQTLLELSSAAVP